MFWRGPSTSLVSHPKRVLLSCVRLIVSSSPSSLAFSFVSHLAAPRPRPLPRSTRRLRPNLSPAWTWSAWARGSGGTVRMVRRRHQGRRMLRRASRVPRRRVCGSGIIAPTRAPTCVPSRTRFHDSILSTAPPVLALTAGPPEDLPRLHLPRPHSSFLPLRSESPLIRRGSIHGATPMECE